MSFFVIFRIPGASFFLFLQNSLSPRNTRCPADGFATPSGIIIFQNDRTIPILVLNITVLKRKISDFRRKNAEKKHGLRTSDHAFFMLFYDRFAVSLRPAASETCSLHLRQPAFLYPANSGFQCVQPPLKGGTSFPPDSYSILWNSSDAV